VDGRDAVQVAVQQRVVDLDAFSSEKEGGGDREDTGDESFGLEAEGSDDEDADDDGHWWRQRE
jgi:hypothetical protein